MDNLFGNKAEEIIQLLMQQNELLEKLLNKKCDCGCAEKDSTCCKDNDSPFIDEDDDEGSCCGGGCH